MLREHLKCFLPLPTSHIVGKMHMSSKCTQHVITGFQVPLPPVIVIDITDSESDEENIVGHEHIGTANPAGGEQQTLRARQSPPHRIIGCKNEPELHSLKYLSDTLVQVLIFPPTGASNPQPLPDEPARNGRNTRSLVHC